MPDRRTRPKRISIHALREEGDQPPEFVLLVFIVFLSTPSARRATIGQIIKDVRQLDFYPRPPRGGRHEQFDTSTAMGISIHALREEGDSLST